MRKMQLTGTPKLINKDNNLWGFEVQGEDGKKLICDRHFSSAIAVALDEITDFLKEDRIEEGQRVTITLTVD